MAKIEMSVEQITDIVRKLNGSSDEISKVWDSIKGSDMETLRQAWKGKDCLAYIEKINEMDIEINKAIKVQRLLSSTFASAKDEIVSMQDDIANKMKGI